MSQASKHIEWCLNKARKEIEECKILGKKPKHKGLLKVNSDLSEAKKHLNKAEHNLKAITTFKNNGFSDWSISAGFYCIYHCFLAIACKFGYESANQTCTIALIEFLKEEKMINLDNKFIDLLKDESEKNFLDLRESYTYGIEVSVKDQTKIADLIKSCKEIIDLTKEIIFH